MNQININSTQTEKCSLILETLVSEEGSHPVLFPRFCPIRRSHSFRIRWDIFIILLCIYNSVSVPLSVGFNLVRDRQTIVAEIDYCVDALFLIDIVFNCFTTYQDVHGEEVSTLHRIRGRYFSSGNLFLDLCSIIPFEEIATAALPIVDSSSLRLIRCLKLVRLLRLRRIISLLKLQKDIKQVLKIGLIMYFLFLFVHMAACLFSLINASASDYTPPIEIGKDPEYYNPNNLSYRYFVSMYYCILMVLGADTVSFGVNQTSFASMVLVLGSMITAVLFGQITVLILALNSASATLQAVMERNSDIMLTLRLNRDVTTLIMDFLSRTHNYRQRQQDLHQFFHMIPEGLKQQVLNYVFRAAVVKCGLFEGEEMEKVIRKLRMVHTKPEETVIRKGDKAKEMFIVSSGELVVFIDNDKGEEKASAILVPGVYFGEVGLVLNCRRSASVYAINYCVLASISALDFDRLATPALRLKMKEGIYQKYQGPWRYFCFSCLRRIPVLSVLPDPELVFLSFKLRISRVTEGSYVIAPGQKPESILIVVSGELGLELDLGSKGKFITLILRRGAVCFGKALLMDVIQLHGLVVMKEAVLLYLDKEPLLGTNLYRAEKSISDG